VFALTVLTWSLEGIVLQIIGELLWFVECPGFGHEWVSRVTPHPPRLQRPGGMGGRATGRAPSLNYVLEFAMQLWRIVVNPSQGSRKFQARSVLSTWPKHTTP